MSKEILDEMENWTPIPSWFHKNLLKPKKKGERLILFYGRHGGKTYFHKLWNEALKNIYEVRKKDKGVE